MTAKRRLALEIRSRKFAFAVLQGTDLLDWGTRRFPPGVPGIGAAIARLGFLLKLYSPSVVVARRTRRVKDKSSEHAAHVLRGIRGNLKRDGILFVALARRDVRKLFAQFGCHTKQEIAAAVAERFGELKSRVPRARKPWNPERNIVAVFDALATAVAFEALREAIAGT